MEFDLQLEPEHGLSDGSLNDCSAAQVRFAAQGRDVGGVGLGRRAGRQVSQVQLWQPFMVCVVMAARPHGLCRLYG